MKIDFEVENLCWICCHFLCGACGCPYNDFVLRSPPVISISGVGDLTGASNCDHYAVWCYLNIARPKTISKTVTYRSLRKIPIHDYRADILRVVECNSETAGALVEQYNGK